MTTAASETNPPGELLAIDLGTLSAKVGLFTRTGHLLSFSRSSYAIHRPMQDQWVEQDPEQWWTAVQGGIREVLRGHDAAHLKAICAGGQGPTLVLVDDRGDPVRPAISWMDSRASEQSAQLRRQLSTDRPSYSLIPRLLWVAQNEPEVFEQTRHAFQAWDFVGYRLSGGTAAVASTMAGDAAWPTAWLEAAGLGASGVIPPHVNSGAPYGETGGTWSAAAGVPKGVPIIGGINDGIGSIVGAAGNVVGRGTDPGGAAGGFALCSDRPLSADGVDCWPGVMPETYIVGGAFVAGGGALNWWASVAQHDDIPAALARAQQAPPGANHLLFLPFLAGERAPLWDPDVRGAFIGLGLSHTGAHLARAVIEASGYALRLLIEPILEAGGRLRELRACGGPAQSRFWNQIKADISGHAVSVPRLPEVALMGNAIYAALGAGFYADVVSAGESMVQIAEVLDPNMATRRLYDDMFGAYKRAYPALKSVFRT